MHPTCIWQLKPKLSSKDSHRRVTKADYGVYPRWYLSALSASPLPPWPWELALSTTHSPGLVTSQAESWAWRWAGGSCEGSKEGQGVTKKPWPRLWVPGVAPICCMALETPSPLENQAHFSEQGAGLSDGPQSHRGSPPTGPVIPGPPLAGQEMAGASSCPLALSLICSHPERGENPGPQALHPRRQTARASLLQLPPTDPLALSEPTSIQPEERASSFRVWGLTLGIRAWGSLSQADQHWIPTPPLPGR